MTSPAAQSKDAPSVAPALSISRSSGPAEAFLRPSPSGCHFRSETVILLHPNWGRGPLRVFGDQLLIRAEAGVKGGFAVEREQ